jgi:hypothetical protein
VELEKTGVASLVSVIFRGASGDHHLVILLGNDGRGGRQAGRVRADQEVGVILSDQSCIQFLHTFLVGFVIIGLDGKFDNRAVGQIDAAGLIDLVHPQVEGVCLTF